MTTNKRNIVVIGASAGGVAALQELVRGLQPDARASFFVVLHFPPFQKSHLPEILSKAGPLPATHPKNGDLFRPGHIYVAPPDHHLLVRDGRVELWRGPKENYTRPAINTLFRSAAENYGPKAIGIILTGLLDDGTAGLIAIKKRGGIAIVQDPDEATYSSMPTSALKHDHVDYSVKLSEMGGLLSTLIDSESREIPESTMTPEDQYSPTELTCPECNGPLSEHDEETFVEFRCRVGHVFSLEAATAAHAETQERMLWSAVVTLEAGAELFRKTAALSEGSQSRRLMAQAKAREEDAKQIRKMLEGLSEEVL